MTLPVTRIQETTVIPAGEKSLVRIRIGDEPPDSASDSTLLTLTVQIPVPRTASIATIEHDAIDLANSILEEHLRRLKDQIRSGRPYA